MALVLGGLVPVAVEGAGGVAEACVRPGGDAARGEERGVGEMEVGETGVEGALGGDVPAEGDVVESAEGEIGLPLETLDVGAEEGGGARGRYGEGGLHDLEAGRGSDGGQCVQREAREEGGEVHRGCCWTMSTPSESASSLPRDTPPARPFRFTWTRPGPASISETTTDGPAHDAFAALPRVHIPTAWSSTTQGFNGTSPLPPPSPAHPPPAVSNVLNNPHKRHAPPKAHAALPPVPPADLPRVKRRDFDPYLRAVAPEWDRFLHVSQSDSPSIPKLTTPLDTVPAVFFSPDFDLAAPRTFDAVTERDHGDHDASSLSYSLPLLEKLSHHADTIEQHLVREISLRSTSFFAALTNLQDLQTESEQCLDRIAKLRALLSDLDNNTAIRALHVVRKESRRSNLAAVSHAVRELAAVVEMASVARGLVAAAQWGEALSVIDSIQSLFNPSPPTPIVKRPARQPDGALPPTPESPGPTTKSTPLSSVPLSSLTAFLSLPSHLQAMNTEISMSLTTDLVSALKLDLLDRVSPVANPDITLKDRLRPLLHGLLRTNGIREAIAAWREVVVSEVRGIMKRVGAISLSPTMAQNSNPTFQHLPSFDPDEDEKSSKAVTRHVCSLGGVSSSHIILAVFPASYAR